jgi:pyrroloquinoline-quinone synthase
MRLGTALGMSSADLTDAKPLPGTAALIDWFELSTKDRSFAEGIGAITVAAEGQVPGNFANFARALERHYGLRTEDVIFFDVHEIADRDHSDVGDSILSRMPLSEDLQKRIRGAVERSLDMWWLFFDGIQQACS